MTAAFTETPAVLGEGAAALHGTLTMPSAPGRHDAVLIWSGAGPADRDGNSTLGLANNCFRLLAHGLAEAGFASLRTDKRGVAASAAAMGPEEDLRFDMFVDDAVLWASWLAARRDVRRVFLLGHGEGGLVLTLAAERVKPAGLVLMSAPGFPAADVLRRQMATPGAGVAEALRRETEAIMAALERGEAVAQVSPELAAAYRPGVQPYLISWFRHDPKAALGSLAVPVLVVQGSNDFQATMEDAKRLAAARPGIRLAPIEGMNHVLKDAPAERAANYATYFRPMLPLSKALLPTLADFLRAATAANDP